MFWTCSGSFATQLTANAPYRTIAVELDFGDCRNDSSFPRFPRFPGFFSPDSSPHDSSPLHHSTTRQTHHIACIPSNSAVNTPRITIPMDTSPSIFPATQHFTRTLGQFPHSTAVPGSRETGLSAPSTLTRWAPPQWKPTGDHHTCSNRVLASNRRVPPSNYAGSSRKTRNHACRRAQKKTERQAGCRVIRPSRPLSADRHRKKR